MSTQDTVESASQGPFSDLISSNNEVASGIGEVISAFVKTASPPNSPVFILMEERKVAFGRKRLGNMSGRNAFLMIKSRFGLLNASTPPVLMATFFEEAEETEFDLESWEELVPHMKQLRILV